MVNQPPDPNERRSRDRDLSFDEWVALLVVFLSVGTILWWGFGRGRVGNVPLLSQASDMLEEPIFEMNEEGDVLDTEEPEGLFFQDPAEEPVEEPTVRRPERVETVQPRGDRPSDIAPIPVTSDPANSAPVTPDAEGETATTAPTPATPTEEEEVPPPLDISDVPEDYWAYPFIKNLYDNGYLPDRKSVV